ncbi:DNA circularization N-terminal domain-containing protein [Shimia sp. R9_3]|uniref:DNA circularization N-terminal domain-containing protein n=1 Tax=Shimia sp. R9_3 TaxID=2821113 RepID=UPI001ADA4CEB|nr:DNA circularization N-terminal domain-containing protein [Shimia sp. R9_3]MBO9402618.1 DNA circularization N-terminal domain-containing protein [Shimia sp. R9_3]
MRPMLDDIPLPQVQTLKLRDIRALAEHRAPGMDGSYCQNMGRHATSILVAGVASGRDAKDTLAKLTATFDAGAPVSFISDIVADAEIENVLIDDFRLREVAGKPDRYAYALVLREYQEPVEPEAVGLLDNDILSEAQSLTDDLIDGLDLLPEFDTGLERFVEPLTGLLTRLQALNNTSNA